MLDGTGWMCALFGLIASVARLIAHEQAFAGIPESRWAIRLKDVKISPNVAAFIPSEKLTYRCLQF